MSDEYLGVEAHRGDLEDLERLAAGARAADGVIHTAFVHDFDAYAGAAEIDRQAIAALASALAGTDKPLVAPSGTVLLPSGRLVDESDEPPLERVIAARVASEQTLLAAAEQGVRACLIRLAQTVHGVGDKAFIPTLIQLARQSGVSAHVGDGSNRWPSVHRLDAAHLFRLALEKAPPGSILHGVAEEGIPLRSIAATIARALHVPVRGIPLEEARAHFEWMFLFITYDNPTSSARTRALLDWHPRGPDLLSDMHQNYFARSMPPPAAPRATRWPPPPTPGARSAARLPPCVVLGAAPARAAGEARAVSVRRAPMCQRLQLART